uniref:Uncharacterized protein n=1 Tax=Eutreptiella gymnastica TaxID=73025 RepID=A0A7S4LMV8_9EUGL
MQELRKSQACVEKQKVDAEAKVQQLQCRIEDKEAVLRERDLHIQSLQQQLEQQEQRQQGHLKQLEELQQLMQKQNDKIAQLKTGRATQSSTRDLKGRLQWDASPEDTAASDGARNWEAEVLALRKKVAKLERWKQRLSPVHPNEREFVMQSRGKFVQNIQQLVAVLHQASVLAGRSGHHLMRYVDQLLRGVVPSVSDPLPASNAPSGVRSPRPPTPGAPGRSVSRAASLWLGPLDKRSPETLYSDEDVWQAFVKQNEELFQVLELIQALDTKGRYIVDAFFTDSEKLMRGVPTKPLAWDVKSQSNASEQMCDPDRNASSPSSLRTEATPMPFEPACGLPNPPSQHLLFQSDLD